MKPDPPDAPLASNASPSGAGSPSTAPSLQHSITPPSVRDHELLRRIRSGSYGEVWLARHVVATFRAVKVVRRATFERAEHFEREFKGMQGKPAGSGLKPQKAAAD